MKKQLLFAAVLLGATSVSAQSFKFTNENGELPHNAEITVTDVELENWGDDEDPFWMCNMESGLHLSNFTENTLDGKVTVVFETPAIGSSSLMFCVSSCIPVSTNSSQDFTLGPNQQYPGFHIAYAPEYGNYGNTRLKFTVTNKAASSDVHTVYVNFNYSDPTGISNTKQNLKSQIYQVGNTVVFNMDLQSEALLTVCDITGKQVLSTYVGNGETTLPELGKGIYIYSVKSANEVISTNKFIVR